MRKTILALGAGGSLLSDNKVPETLPSGEADPGLVFGNGGDAGPAIEAFVSALGRHRHPERETDPPRI